MSNQRPACLTVGEWSLLRTAANGLSARYYGEPVYLVGSALTCDDPRDLDVVVVLDDAVFVKTYGAPGESLADYLMGLGVAAPPAIWRRWARDIAKQGRNLTELMHRACDVKTQPAHLAAKHGGPRVRLDCAFADEAGDP